MHRSWKTGFHAGGAVHEPGLLGDVGVPDEEVLAEGDVGPEDGEAQHELANVVEVVLGDDALELPGGAERGEDDDEQRDSEKMAPAK